MNNDRKKKNIVLIKTGFIMSKKISFFFLPHITKYTTVAGTMYSKTIIEL
jgi:hypothetical protein